MLAIYFESCAKPERQAKDSKAVLDHKVCSFEGEASSLEQVGVELGLNLSEL